MDDARAGVGRHEVGGDNPPGGRLRATGLERCRDRQRGRGAIGVEWRQVGAADERGALEAVDDVELLLHPLAERAGERLGDDVFGRISRISYAGLAEHHVIEIGLHRCELVRGQRPGRRRPGHEVAIRGSAGIIEQGKCDVDARVGHLAVALAHLAAGKRGAPLGPPPDDLVALIEQAAVEELGQRPPDALDVALVIGHVGSREIDPKPDPLGERLPLPHVAPDRLLTLMDKGLDAVGLDLGLGVDAEFLADLHLDGQAMRVPARLPLAVFAPHRAVAGIEILDRTGQAVAGVRHAVGGGRPLEEDKPLRAAAPIERLFVDRMIPPQPRDRGLEGGEVGLAVDRFKHGELAGDLEVRKGESYPGRQMPVRRVAFRLPDPSGSAGAGLPRWSPERQKSCRDAFSHSRRRVFS